MGNGGSRISKTKGFRLVMELEEGFSPEATSAYQMLFALHLAVLKPLPGTTANELFFEKRLNERIQPEVTSN